MRRRGPRGVWRGARRGVPELRDVAWQLAPDVPGLIEREHREGDLEHAAHDLFGAVLVHSQLVSDSAQQLGSPEEQLRLLAGVSAPSQPLAQRVGHRGQHLAGGAARHTLQERAHHDDDRVGAAHTLRQLDACLHALRDVRCRDLGRCGRFAHRTSLP